MSETSPVQGRRTSRPRQQPSNLEGFHVDFDESNFEDVQPNKRRKKGADLNTESKEETTESKNEEAKVLKETNPANTSKEPADGKQEVDPPSEVPKITQDHTNVEWLINSSEAPANTTEQRIQQLKQEQQKLFEFCRPTGKYLSGGVSQTSNKNIAATAPLILTQFTPLFTQFLAWQRLIQINESLDQIVENGKTITTNGTGSPKNNKE